MSSSKQNLKPILIVAALLLASFAVAFMAATQLIGKNKPSGEASSPDSSMVVKDGKTIHQVPLTKYNKLPIDVVLKTGEYVQFNSKDGGDHQVIEGSADKDHGHSGYSSTPVDSGLIKSDEGFLLQFNQSGKYEFHDNYNHHYTITVLVYDPSKSAEDLKLKN